MASHTAPSLWPAPDLAPATRPGPAAPGPAQTNAIYAYPVSDAGPASRQAAVSGVAAPRQATPRQAVPHPATSGPVVPGLAHAPTAAVRADAPTVPAHMLPQRTPAQLLAIARDGLAEAARTGPDGLRYAAAHLAALRAAAAVLAARARPAAPTRRSRVTSVWSLLVLVAPEFADWAGYFALGATKRAAAEAGIPRVVSPREADDLLRAAEQFVTVVESSLGHAYQPPLAA